MEKRAAFIPHGHCYSWISAIWICRWCWISFGIPYVGISLLLHLLAKEIRYGSALSLVPLASSAVTFIGLGGITHFMNIRRGWNPGLLDQGDHRSRFCGDDDRPA